MVPVPRFESWEAFNADLAGHCHKRGDDVLRGHRESIGERFGRDQEALMALPPAPFDACEKMGTRVNSLSLVRYRSNDYSVPVAYGLELPRFGGELVAHARPAISNWTGLW